MARRRATAIADQRLFDKQMQTISETLTKASRRRNEEVQLWKPKSTSPAKNPTAASPVEPKPVSSGEQSDTDRDQLERLEQLRKDILTMDTGGLSASVYATSPPASTGQTKISLREAFSETDGSWSLIEPSHQAASSKISESWRKDLENVDPKELLAEFEKAPAVKEVAVNASANFNDDPLQMLAELDQMKTSSARWTSEKEKNHDHDSTDDDDDVALLHHRLQALIASVKGEMKAPPGLAQNSSNRAKNLADLESLEMEAPPVKIDPKLVPYVTALALEDRSTQWQQVKDWIPFMFSNDSDSYTAQNQRELAVLEAEKKLEGLIERTVNEEMTRPSKEKRRLIVRNIAAAADEGDIQEAFFKFGVHVHDVHFMPDRDTGRQTRTAYIDMIDEQTAIAVIQEYKRHIFGLILNIELATTTMD